MGCLKVSIFPRSSFSIDVLRAEKSCSLMADQMISPFVGKLVDYLAVPVGRQFNYLFCYNGNLEEFRRQLRGLEMAGLDVKRLVEAAEGNGEIILPSVEDWLKRVESVSEESKRFVGEEDAIDKCCFNGPLNPKVRYQRSRKAKKKVAEFDAIKKDATFHSVALPAPPPQIGFTSNENEIDFQSRRSIFNEIMEAIKDNGVGMIGIWGMPGIGKTTLVKRIAKYAKDEGLFEVVAMAVVSQKSSVKAIQGGIGDTIGLNFTTESEEGRAGQLLQRLLSRKKVMVILDDIWNRIELNDIGIPCGNQHKGCKIILTSRILDVCEQMGTEKNFKIDLLSKNEALDLFLRMSSVDDRSSEKGQLAEKLSEECGRLPISIVVVARGLLNKPEVTWTDRLNRLRNSDPDKKVCACIQLSYENLDRKEEKMFFLLCALFPEDYEIPVQVLFEYGIGLDLFEKVDNVDEALVRADNLASSLKASSLLLDEGSEKFVKMHDVVRDVALAIASEGQHRFLVRSVTQWREWSKKTAIAVWSDDDKKLPDSLECPQLQILMVNCRHPNLQLHENFFIGMKNLVVLDILDMEFVRLPQSFAALENLQTLRLNDCKLGDISAIGKLQNLVSLSFYNSNIEVLPKEVGELSNLRFLDLSSCDALKVITPGVIQNLSQLEALYMGRNVLWCVAEEDGSPKSASFLEFIDLSRLMILEICVLDASMLPDEELFENLTKFKISIGDDDLERKKIFCSTSPMLALKRVSKNMLAKPIIKMLMKKAQHLELEDISGILVALSSNFSGFGSLKELIMSHCKDVNYILDVNGLEDELETPSLHLLHLIDLPLLKEISRGEFPSFFVSKLEHLRLYELPSLVQLWQFPAESISLADLTTVKIDLCDKLKYIFERGVAKSLLKLKELDVGKCKNLKAIYLSKEDEQDEEIAFPRLSHLKLSELIDFTSFESKFNPESTPVHERQNDFIFSYWIFTPESTLFSKKVNVPALETLDIYCLNKFGYIWPILTPAESFLQLKVLKLINCWHLLTVFPPQATSNLRNLEEIRIENCGPIETLFQLDGVHLAASDLAILFPRLVKLKLVNLPKLTALLKTTSQNISRATVSFPILKSIHMEGLKKIKKIWHDEVSPECFGQLHQLHISKCDQLVEVFPCHLVPNLHRLEKVTVKKCILLEKLFELDSCHVSETKTMTILKQLRVLNLDALPVLRRIWSTNGERLSGVKVICPTMEIMVLCRLHNLEAIVEPLLVSFPRLKKLHLETIGPRSSNTDQLRIIQGLDTLEELIIKDSSLQGEENLRVIATLSKLRKWQLCFSHESFELIESLDRRKGFQSLTSLNFCHCDGLKSLLTPSIVSCLVHLEELFVTQCRTMESIVRETDEEKHLDKVIEFSKLQTLVLDNLPQLTSFYSGGRALRFPCLNEFSIENCRKLKTFASMAREMAESSSQNFAPEAFFGQQVLFGGLKYLRLRYLQSMEEILHHDHPAMSLDELILLKIEKCNGLSLIFPSNLISGLQNLSVLHVEACDSLEHVFKVEDHHPPSSLSKLQELKLKNLPKLKQLWWNEKTCESFGLPSLRSLTIEACLKLQFLFDPSVGGCLENLRSLFVEDCSSIVEIVAEKPRRKIVFPLLDTIHLVKLQSFSGFPAELQSVEFQQAVHVIVHNCLNTKGIHLRYYVNNLQKKF